MPKIGEIGRNKNYTKSIWMACPDCNKEHWVRLYKGKPQSVGRCRPCSLRVNRKLINRCGSNNPSWKGGRVLADGYWLILLNPEDKYYQMASHKKAGNKRGHYILEHRLIMAKYLGRCLHSWEIVHHKNGIKTDNHIGNLELLPSLVDHLPSIAWQRELNKRDKVIAELEQCIQELERKLGNSKTPR